MNNNPFFGFAFFDPSHITNPFLDFPKKRTLSDMILSVRVHLMITNECVTVFLFRAHNLPVFS